jgi:hypothetical protein
VTRITNAETVALDLHLKGRTILCDEAFMSRKNRMFLLAAAAMLVVVPLRAQTIRSQAKPQRAQPLDAAAGLDGRIMQQVTFGQLIAAINSQPNHVARLKGMTDLQASGVRLVDAASLTGGNAQALQNALERNQRTVADMRTAVEASTVINGMLGERDLTTANVIAVDVAANGTVWVFYRQ